MQEYKTSPQHQMKGLPLTMILHGRVSNLKLRNDRSTSRRKDLLDLSTQRHRSVLSIPMQWSCLKYFLICNQDTSKAKKGNKAGVKRNALVDKFYKDHQRRVDDLSLKIQVEVGLLDIGAPLVYRTRMINIRRMLNDIDEMQSMV